MEKARLQRTNHPRFPHGTCTAPPMDQGITAINSCKRGFVSFHCLNVAGMELPVG